MAQRYMTQKGKYSDVLALCPDNGAVYSGETKDVWAHGKGKFTFAYVL